LASPQTSGLFTDFDGTLSQIVRVPSQARPLAGVSEVLAELAGRYRAVVVVSGRSASELLEWLGPDIEIWGTHGVERTQGGEIVLSEQAAAYEQLMTDVAAEAAACIDAAGLEGAMVEDKRIVLGLHYRSAPNREHAKEELQRIARELADRHGLVVVSGKASFELRPPIELSKRAVVEQRARQLELSAACFIGDDLGDLPAFDALDALGSEKVATLRVAVDSDEAPEELVRRADLVVEGPAEVVELLRTLAR
jgi:trehalose 6-phosphate phosphatase